MTSVGIAQDFTLQPVRTFYGHEHGVKKAVFAPDGKTFASGGTRGELMVWNVETGEVKQRMEGHYSSITDLRYTNDGKFITTAANDGHVKVWDAATGKLVRKFNTAENVAAIKNTHFALLSEDGQVVYFGGDDRRLQIGLVGSDEPCRTLYTDKKDPIRCAALSPNGREIIFAAGQYLIVFDLVTNKLAREYNTGTCDINALQFSEDGKILLSWCANARVDIRNAQTFLLKTSFRAGTGGRKFSNISLSDDQKYVITGDHASRFNMWDLTAKRLVMDEGADQGTIQDFDVETSLNYVLSASLDKTIKLWKITEKIVEEEPKKKAKDAPVVEPAPQVVILTQDETQDDFTPMETREPEAPTQVVKVAPVPVPAVVASVPTEVPKEQEQKVEAPASPTPTASANGDSISVIPDRLNGRSIRPLRSDHRLNLLSRNLTFQIWDAQIIDGDIISIYINDQIIVKEYSIVNEHLTVKFNAKDFKKAYLYLHAHNVGSIPPNTATMMISDGVQEIQVELRSDLTGSAAVELNFVD
jgi:hypothetical protein